MKIKAKVGVRVLTLREEQTVVSILRLLRLIQT